MSDSITSRVLFNVFKGILLALSLIIFAIAFVMNKSNMQQDKWPATKAKVLHSQVVKKQTTVLGRKAQYYDMNIRYIYIVNKKKYKKTGLFVGPTDKNLPKDYFLKKSEKYFAGEIVKVHYNPQNPKQAYLLANIDESSRTFYRTSRDLLCFSIFLFLITPFIRLFKNKRYVNKNTVKQEGLVVPDDAIRVQPIRKHR